MSDQQNILNNLSKELGSIDFKQVAQYDGRNYIVDTTSNLSLAAALREVFNCDDLPANKLEFNRLDSKLLRVKFYDQEKEFISDTISSSGSTLLNQYIFFLSPDKGSNFQCDSKEQVKKFKINVFTYSKILELFKNIKDLALLNDPTSKTLTLVTKQYGVFNVGYQTPTYNFFYRINISGKDKQLETEFKKKEFIQFFKEIIVTSVHRLPDKDRFQALVEQLDSIIDLTSKDYEAYVSEFAIDKIKSEFKKERESYFESIDRSISSIGKQVVAFPLTFAASVFASYKVQDKPGILLLILFAYLLYTIVAYLILSLTSYNVRCLRKDVQSEKATIKNEYGKIYEDFQSDFEKIEIKIGLLRIVVTVLFVVLTLLFLLFLLYAAHSMTWIDLSSWVTWGPEVAVSK